MGKKSFSHLGEVRIDFFSKIESCFNEIQYQATKRRHCKQTNRDLETLSLAKVETPRQLRINIETARRT